MNSLEGAAPSAPNGGDEAPPSSGKGLAPGEESAGGPGELALGEEVDVEVGDAFAGVGAVVDDKTEAALEVEFFRDDAGGDEEVAECVLVGGRGFADARDDFFRDDEEVDGRGGLDIVDHNAAVVLVLDLRGDFAGDAFLKESFGHEKGADGGLGAEDRGQRTEDRGRRDDGRGDRVMGRLF